MATKTNKNGFMIPMIVSMILLIGFVGYFLKSEYTKEKHTIVLEEKNDLMFHVLSTIDTIRFDTILKDNKFAGEWKHDSIDGVKSIKLEYIETSTDDFSETEHGIINDSLRNMAVGIKKLSLKNEPTDLSTLTDSVYTQVIFRDQGDWSFKTKSEKGSPHDINNSGEDIKNFMKILVSGDKQKLDDATIQNVSIAPLDILKRISPQIFFSTFLIGSVFLSFYLIAKSLKRERQLALMRNDLISNMSHELKTPVSTIGVALEALSNFDAADDPTLRKEYINISKMEVDRLGLLVDKTLNISLYEQGKFVFDSQNIDINVEIEKILKTMTVQFDNINAHVNYKAEGHNFVIQADRTHMINVIHNLLENAIKYSKENPKLEVSVFEKANTVEVSIKDNGLGIPHEYQDQIFDKFFRVPQGNRHNIKGHGLGLSYVKKVIESQGGRVMLISDEGIGSTFRISMPKGSLS